MYPPSDGTYFKLLDLSLDSLTYIPTRNYLGMYSTQVPYVGLIP